MALQLDSTYESEHPRPLEPWVWPMTAAIVVSGSLVFWSLVGMFWLATHPARQATVIWMQPAAVQETGAEQTATAYTSARLEKASDAHTN
jgi:hypothetical protein